MPTYLVTGANRGLGLEFVRQLSSDQTSSNKVIAAVRSLDGDLTNLRRLEKEASGGGSTVHIITCDTSSNESIKSVQDQLPSILGAGEHVDVLINNAGINTVPQKGPLDISPEEIQSHINVNVVGPSEVAKVVLPHMVSGGLLVNMSSGLGSFGRGIVGDKKTAYSISKAALNMLSAHQAAMLAEKGIRVICLDPGWVQTDMGGANAAVTPNDSIAGMLKVIGKVVENHQSGLGEAQFYQYDGDGSPW